MGHTTVWAHESHISGHINIAINSIRNKAVFFFKSQQDIRLKDMHKH